MNLHSPLEFMVPEIVSWPVWLSWLAWALVVMLAFGTILQIIVIVLRRRLERARTRMKCPTCNGEKRINHFCGMGACVDDPCPTCEEKGWVPRTLYVVEGAARETA